MRVNNPSELFVKSALCLENQFNDLNKIKKWVVEQNQRIKVNISKINFNQLDNWLMCDVDQNLKHTSGKFFSIDGIEVKTNWSEVSLWQQPIINQPEIGYLGFITKTFDGILYFLLQAKVEPGNINHVQLSPTLQATKSNYTQVHKGKAPAYLNYFINAQPHQILIDQLQSEQGARFLKKRNRNIIIKVDEHIELKDNFIWATLAQIKLLMQDDNLVNMDTRTVISGISFSDNACVENKDSYALIQNDLQTLTMGDEFLRSHLSSSGAINNFDSIIQFITNRKCYYELDVKKIPLLSIKDWVFEPNQIRHAQNKYFKVIAARVEIENREVTSWTQPMIEPAQEGICAFICKNINGIIHFIVQAKLEAGNFDIIELAPTVQCLTGNYNTALSYEQLPFLNYVLSVPKEQIVFDTLQSEEGGRFYKEQNRNVLILADESFDNDLPENYIWMSLNQLLTFIKFNNYLNIQARSLIAAISYT
jgi:oxidase EvaA